MQDTILKICKQIHELLPLKRIAITRFVGKYEYGQIYVGELDRKVKREPCDFMFIKRDFCVVYSQDPAKNQEEARQDFEFVCRTLEDNCAFLFEPRWYKTFFDVFETTLILEFQVWERYERYPGSAIPVMEVLDSDYPSVVYDGSFVLSFMNTEHPDFPVELPDDIIADKNSYVKLPFVSGQHTEDDETWAPYAWDIGEFGQSVRMDSDKVANLLWKEQFSILFMNTTYPQFDVDLPEQMVVNEGSSIMLPSVSGQFVEDDYVYTPSGWDIGTFGSEFTPTENTTAILLWHVEYQVYTVSFENTQLPDITIDLPESESGTSGTVITLPTVTGEYESGGKTYQPTAWDIGAFGSSYTISGDVVANLLFEEVETYEEIRLYVANGGSAKHAQPNITSSFTGDVNTSYIYQLYTDAEATIPWNGYDYSNDYEVGYYSGVTGEWVKRPDVSGMPDSTASSSSNSKISYILLDTGYVWIITNLTSSEMLYPSYIIVRIRKKNQKHYALYFNTSSVYNNKSLTYDSAYDLYGSPNTGSHPIPLTSNFPDKTIVGVYGSAGNLVSAGYKNFAWVGSSKLRVGYYNTNSGTLSARLLLFTADQNIIVGYINTSGNTSVYSGSAKRLYSKDGYYLIYLPSQYTYTPLALFKYDGSCADDSSGHYINTTTLGNYTGPSDALCMKQTYGTISFSYIWFLITPIS